MSLRHHGREVCESGVPHAGACGTNEAWTPTSATTSPAGCPSSPHESAGVDCCGCIIAAVDATNVELRCNECGAVVGVIQVDILKGLLGLECATATCPHGSKVNTFPGFTKVSTYVCAECGEAVGCD